MPPCRYGSEAQPGAAIDAGLLYFSDLGIPSSSLVASGIGDPIGDQTLLVNRLNFRLRAIGSPATFRGDLTNISIDVDELIGQVTHGIIPLFSPAYNFIPIYSRDLNGFCEQQPTIDDIPASLFRGIPFIDAEGYRRYCLLALQERWYRNCRCSLPTPSPQCSDPILAGRGQCLCQVYYVRSSFYWVDYEHKSHVKRKTFEWVYGPLRIDRFVDITSYGPNDPGIQYNLVHHGGVSRNSLGQFYGTYQPCGVQVFAADLCREQYLVGSTPILELDIQIVGTTRSDNCCEPPPRDPTPEPDDPSANDGNHIYNDPEDDNVTIIIVPGFCNPSACTTQPGTPGTDGDKGDKGDKGDTGAIGKDGDDGADGADGADGLPGIAGSDGADGSPGADGSDGANGAKGDKGDKGETGVDGLPGSVGSNGSDGLPGSVGSNGSDGLPGPAGSDGADGLPGPVGSDGADGLPGADGADGLPGPVGSDGSDGLPGADGADGLPGLVGSNGTDGSPGADGAKGDKGDKGDKSTIALNNISTVGMNEPGRAILVSGTQSDPVYDLEIPDSMEIINTTVQKFICDSEGLPKLIDVAVPVVAARVGNTAGLYVTLFGEIAKLLAKLGCAVKQVDADLLDRGESSLENRVFYIPISDEVKTVSLNIVNQELPASLSIYSTANETQTKFGNICLCVNGLQRDADPGWMWTRTTFYRIPETKLSGRSIRINLKPGLIWQLHDTGER